MSEIFGLAFPFFGLIFLGYGCGRIVRMPPEGLAGLSFFIIYLALPALFYRIVSRTPIEELTDTGFILTVLVSTTICSALAFGIGMWVRRGNIGEAAIAGTIGGYSNTGYMGPGLAFAALGQAAASPAAIIFACDSVFFFTMVPLLMALQKAEGQRESLASTILLILKRVFTHPFNVATLLGITAAATHFQEPEPIGKILEYLKNAAAPCALFTLGMSVAIRPLKRVPVELGPLLATKLLVHPVVALVVLGLVGGFSPIWAQTLLLMTALPPALNVFILAQQYRTYVEEASAAVMLGTVASVVTLTTMLYLIKANILPLQLF